MIEESYNQLRLKDLGLVYRAFSHDVLRCNNRSKLYLNPNHTEGGVGRQICPQLMKIVNSPGLYVGFISNQAVNLRLYVVL